MAYSPSPFPLEALMYKSFNEIKGDFCSDEVICRLIHFWEARNFKKDNSFMGLGLLLINCQSTVIQGFIPASRLLRYETGLKANSIYKLKKSILNPSKAFFKTTDHKKEISFIDQTIMVEVRDAGAEINQQGFRLRLANDFAAIVDRNGYLFDIIGKITLIRGDNLHSPDTMDKAPQVSDSKAKDRVFLHLQLKDGDTIRIYLWEKFAAAFRRRWNDAETKPTVMLFTTVNAKTVGGTLSLTSTSSTRLFFDNEIPETKDYLNWLGQKDLTTPTVTTSSSAVTKLETITINELHGFIRNETPQEASFNCVATIDDILDQYGWHYISCSNCKTKLGKTNSFLYCGTCNKTNNIGLTRYRFEISVHDNTDVATFVIMDTDGTKFAGKTATEILNQANQGGFRENTEGNRTTPQCLLHIIGRTFKFQVKVNKYNFVAGRQTYTVSRATEATTTVAPKSGGEDSETEEFSGAAGKKIKEVGVSRSCVDPTDFTLKKKQKLGENCTPAHEEETENVE